MTYLTNFEKKFVKLDLRNPGRFAFSTLLHENENKMGANFFPRKKNYNPSSDYGGKGTHRIQEYLFFVK